MTDKTEPQEGERLAFDEAYNNYRAIAFYRDDHEARIVITRDGEVVLENAHYPAYRIWNVAAHLRDIAEDMEEQRSAESEKLTDDPRARERETVELVLPVMGKNRAWYPDKEIVRRVFEDYVRVAKALEAAHERERLDVEAIEAGERKLRQAMSDGSNDKNVAETAWLLHSRLKARETGGDDE